MTFNVSTSTIRTLKPGDDHYTIHEGVVTTQRAGFTISANCPDRYADIILECYKNKWLVPQAHFTERELVLLGLSKNE
jgi:hypothetical protein